MVACLTPNFIPLWKNQQTTAVSRCGWAVFL